jgi:hypothetical protein
MAAYSTALVPFGVYPDMWWHASDPVVLPNFTLPSSGRDAMIVNLGGLIFYTDDTSPRLRNAFATVTTYSGATDLFRQLMPILLIPSNSSVNELGRATYAAEFAKATLQGLQISLIAGSIGLALYAARYGMI